MNAKRASLVERKALLVAQVRMQRIELGLRATELRDAMRPSALIGGTIARPAIAVALLEAAAPFLGWGRLARLVRTATVGFLVFRLVRSWRAR